MHLHDDVRVAHLVVFYKVLSSSERFTSFPLMWWSEVYRSLNIRFVTILKKLQSFPNAGVSICFSCQGIYEHPYFQTFYFQIISSV